MFATILVPKFYLQAITRHQPLLREQPLAVLDASARKAIVLELNDAAQQQGIRPGMTPSQALGRCLHLVIKARARAQETQLSDILLHHAFILSPWVEATAPGVCTVEFRGVNEQQKKVEHILHLLARCDITARAGIAENADTSFLAAQLAEPVLQVDETEKFLASLPIEALTLEPAW